MKRKRRNKPERARGGMRQSVTAGLPPGTPVHVAEPKTAGTTLAAICYNARECAESRPETPEAAAALLSPDAVLWLDVTGIADIGVLERLGQVFKLHPLITEDLVNTGQRPKFEDYGEVVYLVLRRIGLDAAGEVVNEQMSLILGANFVISVQESSSGIFNAVRERIRRAQGRVRGAGADYLTYRLVDAVVDHYYVVLEKLGDNLEDLSDDLLDGVDSGDLARIHNLRQQMIHLRKAVWPLRDVMSMQHHADTALISRETQVYLRDVYDHTVQAIDTIETYREMLSDMLDIYLTGVNLKLNEVMKVLTVIATIFLPLSFLASLWGMNFRFMPELDKPWGYPLALGVMALTVGGMLMFFRRKGWM